MTYGLPALDTRPSGLKWYGYTGQTRSLVLTPAEGEEWPEGLPAGADWSLVGLDDPVAGVVDGETVTFTVTVPEDEFSHGLVITADDDPVLVTTLYPSTDPAKVGDNSTTSVALSFGDEATVSVSISVLGSGSGGGGGGGAPTDAGYLVTEASTGLSNEVVVGTSPGGELGGTWAAPTVDAVHSGSSHAAVQAAAEATASADATTKASAAQAAAIAAAATDATTKADAAKARSTHTGTQPQSTVDGLVADLAARMDLATAQAVTAGAKKSLSHSATTAGLRLVPASGAPSSRSSGDLWFDSADFRFRFGGLAGVTKTVVSEDDPQTLTNKTLTTPTLTSPVLNTGVSGTAVDTDGTLAGNSDTKLPSQKAVKTYVDTEVAEIPDLASGAGITLSTVGDVTTISVSPGANDQYVIAPSDVSRTSTIAVADDSVLSLVVTTNAVYEVMAYLIYDGDSAGDFRSGWSAPTGATFNWGINALRSAASSGSDSFDGNNRIISDTAISGAVGVGTSLRAQVVGVLTTAGTSGSFVFRWAQGTSSATATTRKAGSYLRLRRLA